MVHPRTFSCTSPALVLEGEQGRPQTPSPYVGGRTLKWLKVKQRGYRVEKQGLNTRE